MKEALLILAAVAAAHAGYYLWPKGSADRQWAFYVASNALIVVALLCRRAPPPAWRGVLLFACWWGAIESAQCAVCGVLRWGSLPELDLCVESFGPDVYAMLSAAAIALVLVLRKGIHGRT